MKNIEAVRRLAVGVDVVQSGFAFVAYALLEKAGLLPGDYEIQAGLWESELVEASTTLLGLTEREAQAHQVILRDPNQGLVASAIDDGTGGDADRTSLQVSANT